MARDDRTPADEFMYSRRRDPRPAFVDALKQELDAQPPASERQPGNAGRTVPGRIWQHIAGILLVLAGLFAVSFSVSPDVRAMTRSLLGIEGEVPLEIAQQAIGFELPQYLPDEFEMTSLCSSAVDFDCDPQVSAQAWMNLSEEGIGWASVYYTRRGLEEESRWITMILSVQTFHPDKDMSAHIEHMEARWDNLGDIGGVYNAPRINRAIGYQTYRTRDGVAGSTTLEWFQDDLKYTLRLYNPAYERTTDELLREARQIARSVPSSEAADTP